MKKIVVPKDTFPLAEIDEEGKRIEKKGGFYEFVTIILRSCPSSKGTIDKVFEVGKLCAELKDNKSEELILDNDEYKLVENACCKEMFEKWESLKRQTGYTPTGWEATGLSPLSNEAMSYLKAIKETQDFGQVK